MEMLPSTCARGGSRLQDLPALLSMERRRKPDLDAVRDMLSEEDARVRDEPAVEEPTEDDKDDGEGDEEAGS
jgi:hypothetical protein